MTDPSGPDHGTRMSLVTRTVLLTSAIAAIAVLIAGLLSYPLVKSAADSQARSSLVVLADLTATALDRGTGDRDDDGDRGPRQPLPPPLQDGLVREGISGWQIPPGAELPQGVPADGVAAAAAGQPVSTSGGTGADPVLIEMRPLASGSVLVLQQPAEVAGGEATDALKRIALALLVGLLIAVPIGYWAARRMTRPLRAARDAANQMAAGSRDVTLELKGPVEIADIAHSLNGLNAALVLSEARQREFLLSVSHDMRTPLTAVKGYAEAMSDGLIAGDEVERTGATVAAEAARLDRLVTDLLDLARLGAVDFRISPVDVDLVELGEDAGIVWRDRAARDDVDFQIEVPAQSIHVNTDPTRLRQIIDNLAENALRVSPPGTLIVLSVRSDGPWAVVEVRDSGPGLTPEDLADAFEPGVLHERYRGVRPVGTGLGLALVGKLATGLGGSAQASTATEGGACFTVRIPRFPNADRLTTS